jgi:hypothetical protein
MSHKINIIILINKQMHQETMKLKLKNGELKRRVW